MGLRHKRSAYDWHKRAAYYGQDRERPWGIMGGLSGIIPFSFMVRIMENTPVYVKYSTQQADEERSWSKLRHDFLDAGAE